MTITSVRPGDLVEADVRGLRFMAKVLDKDDRELVIEPFARCITYTRVTAREVVGHWRKAGRTRSVQPDERIAA